jgi:hypothetical protein
MQEGKDTPDLEAPHHLGAQPPVWPLEAQPDLPSLFRDVATRGASGSMPFELGAHRFPREADLQRPVSQPLLPPTALKTESTARAFHAEVRRFVPSAELELLSSRAQGAWTSEVTEWRIHSRESSISAVDLRLSYAESPEWGTQESFRATYRVHDERLAGTQQEFRIRSVRRKSIPVVGPAMEVSWRGSPSGIIRALSSSSELTRTVRRGGDLKIRSDPVDRSWILDGLIWYTFNMKWPAYDMVGRLLLEAPINV